MRSQRSGEPRDVETLWWRLDFTVCLAINPLVRLRLLCNLYNLLKSGTSERLDALVSIIEYAKETMQVGAASLGSLRWWLGPDS
jgi:hypothetical protein